MTTDTVPKLVHRQGELNGTTFNVVGLAKGSGMIAPNMATMLCTITTDARISPALAHQAATGQSGQRGARETQTVAPSSIVACVQVAGSAPR